ncbi:MAG: four helix bundle protein [Calditrichaceae bacterium]|nr:four helix bundle protein [Calditrichia bacterium]NUQ40151.1 four helix bundle protein [Calditrichaceae bacterium]
MTYEDWVRQVPDSIRIDPLWAFQVYPKALFLSDLAWEDSGKMLKDARGRKIADQLIDSAGSVSANIEEGFGRGFGKDYARFLSISLGSARECRGWYYRGRRLLSDNVLRHRYRLLDEIIALLTTHIQKQRKHK